MPSFDSASADAAALSEAKRLLRHAVGLRRRARPEAQRQADDAARTELIKATLVDGQRPSLVALYFSQVPEPGTLELIAWLASVRVRVVLPVVRVVDGQPGEPDWAPYAGTDQLREGAYGLVEPTTAPLGPAILAEASVVVVPALAATVRGERLGRGGGWYDRALLQTGAATRTWALLNEGEIMDVVPAQPWDVPVHALVTPTRMITCA